MEKILFVASIITCLHINIYAQTTLPLQTGNVVFTCECDNINNPVLAMMDLNCPANNNGAPSNDPDVASIWSDPVSTLNSMPDWTCGVLGSVHGMATDEEEGIGVEKIYVGSTGSIFWGNRELTTLIPNPTGGEVICIDGITGAATVLASLPNSYSGTQADPYYSPGIQQLAYNSDEEVVYAANGDNGIIYVIDSSTGNILGTFDHAVSQGLAADDPSVWMTQYFRYIGAVQYNPCDSKLYYATYANTTTDWYIRYNEPNRYPCHLGSSNPNPTNANQFDIQVWCIATDANGNTTGNPSLLDTWYASYECAGGVAAPHDIAFTSSCGTGQRMMVSTNAMFEQQDPIGDNMILQGPHRGQLIEYTFDGTNWVNQTSIDIGFYGRDAQGLDYGTDQFTDCTAACPVEDARIVLSDRAYISPSNQAYYGFTITTLDYTAGTYPEPVPDYTEIIIVDINGSGSYNDKNSYYDVEYVGISICPTFTSITSSDQDLDCGDTASDLTLNVTPTGSYNYQWQESTVSCGNGFLDIPGATSDTYSISSLSDTTYYRVLISEVGCLTSCQDSSNCITVNYDISPSCMTISTSR